MILSNLSRVTNTNVILLTIPYSHDLNSPNITLNSEIINFNKKTAEAKKKSRSYCNRNKWKQEHLY
jgi:hypothetical protein